MNKRANLGSNAAAAFFGNRKEANAINTTSTDNANAVDSATAVNNITDVKDANGVNSVNTSKKTGRFSLYLPPEEKEYLDIINWYDRSGSINSYIVNLIRKDKQLRDEEYQKAINLMNNK